ncbi:MAG: hypothetical protein Q8Q88_15695 [Phenylobacterium sp.]|uniref:hypothetical protein n=1 Tax=Phenylobacterium sp. TaxID=1871053 RepID=UPI002733D209|nr:hypothetical protein [Phenylobacterium sp.]MDP3748482.1 hypothetical protein [Phenylobacterium sp.]
MTSGSKGRGLTEHHDRCVSLILHDFPQRPDEIADWADYGDVAVVMIGDKAGHRAVTKNRITWRQPINADVPWDDGLADLVRNLGGRERVAKLLSNVRPKAAWIRINLPSIGSPWQESAGLGRESIQLLADLELEFDIAMFAYDDSQWTHRPKS